MFKHQKLLSIYVIVCITTANSILSPTTKQPIQTQFNKVLVDFQPQLNKMSVLAFKKRPAANRFYFKSDLNLKFIIFCLK
jgi:hydroxymethylpyrimidine/phosphomethylpyrimidine kinase